MIELYWNGEILIRKKDKIVKYFLRFQFVAIRIKTNYKKEEDI